MPASLWRRYIPGEKIKGRFQQEDWPRIFYGIDNDNQLADFAVANPETVTLLLLGPGRKGREVGIVMLLLTDSRRRQLSLHGGAWTDTLSARLLMYRGLYLLFNKLFEEGYRLCSSSVDNPQAVRFMKSFGFRINSYRRGRTSYYLTSELLARAETVNKVINRYKQQNSISAMRN